MLFNCYFFISVVIFDPTTGIIRPVHRAYLCHAHSGEIPLFESHFQRWNISLSEHHSQAPPSLEHKLESPATWNRSLFGPLPGDIKRCDPRAPSLSSFIIHAEHTLSWSLSAPVPYSEDLPRHLHLPLSRLKPHRDVSCLPSPSRRPVEETATLCWPPIYLVELS